MEEEFLAHTRLRIASSSPTSSPPVVIVANREPYVHEHSDSGIVVRRPPGGLVTALEPLLRDSGGTWIAHGAGSADFDVTRTDGVVAVPPGEPRYSLQRLFLSEQEIARYYCGFANEALWPLCHQAYAQPAFRDEEWETYRAVNRRFARAAAQAGAHGAILVQDYHFALVPREIRELAPHAAVNLFWHIPWPGPNVAAICPWMPEILAGMLGADTIGFHTRRYCRNFLQSVADLVPGARVDFDAMTVSHAGRRTLVRAYPISIEWPYPAAGADEGAALRRELGIGDDVHVALGIDRCDYTKGLLERVEAIELLLDEHRELAGRFIYVQVAAASRMNIGRYRNLAVQLEAAVARVNARFGPVIVLRTEPLPPEDVRRYYAMADSAIVTPLQDGMNLVAKEYAASCGGDRGVLVLSRFAGAAEELDGALLVNPFHVRDIASAIARAMTMPAAERAARLATMREAIARNTIHDWSSRLLSDLLAARRRNETRRELLDDAGTIRTHWA